MDGQRYIHIHTHMLSLVTQSRLTLYNLMDCSPPGFSVNGMSQARILDWVSISFSIYIYIYITHTMDFPSGSVEKNLFEVVGDASSNIKTNIILSLICGI